MSLVQASYSREQFKNPLTVNSLLDKTQQFSRQKKNKKTFIQTKLADLAAPLREILVVSIERDCPVFFSGAVLYVVPLAATPWPLADLTPGA